MELETSTFGAGVERVWHRRIMRFMLEMNTLVLEMNEFNTRVRFSATHIHQLLQYQRLKLPNRTYALMIANQSYPPPKMGAMTPWTAKRYLDSQWRLWLHYM